MNCKTCRLPVEVRFWSAVSSLLPWLGSQAFRSARVQRSSGAAAMNHLFVFWMYIRMRYPCGTGALACVFFTLQREEPVEKRYRFYPVILSAGRTTEGSEVGVEKIPAARPLPCRFREFS